MGLASHRLYVSGREVLWDMAERNSDEEPADLVVIESGQQVFHAAISQYLERIEYVDEYAGRIFLPITHDPLIVIDPRRNYATGAQRSNSGGAPARAVLQRLGWGTPGPARRGLQHPLELSDLELVAGERAPAVAS